MKQYRRVIISKMKHPGKEDRRRARARLIDLPAMQDVQEPAMTPKPPSTHRPTAEDLAALDADSGSAAPPVYQTKSLPSPSGLSSAPSRLVTLSCERDTPPLELVAVGRVPASCPHDQAELPAPTSVSRSTSSHDITAPPPTPISRQGPPTPMDGRIGPPPRNMRGSSGGIRCAR